MSRPGRVLGALLIAAPCLLPLSPAAADPAYPIEIGGWFGPRIFSGDSKLGYIEGKPHLGLASTVAFGPRIGAPLLLWLVPEFELAFAPTQTATMSLVDKAARVYWLDPRVQARFELMPGRRLQPFAIVGASAPIAISMRSSKFDSSATGSGYLGGGVRFDSLKGFMLRFDARIAFLPAVDSFIAAEVDIGFGVEFTLGGTGARPTGERIASGGRGSGRGGGRGGDRPGDRPGDRDEDGIPDEKDGCPDRPEDLDGYEDQDGCPDIDNDLDRVLDIADKCPAVPETYNGYQDDDGCPDTLPPEIDGLKGTVEGLIYSEGETLVRGSAAASIARIVKIMTAYTSIRVVLIGHTDDREAKQFATGDDIEIEGEPAGAKRPPPDVAALSADLSRARAEAVKQAIVAKGIAAPRIDVQGHGAEEPVSDNDRPRGRLANRRVEIKLYVPPSGRSR